MKTTEKRHRAGGVALALDGASGDVVLVQRLPLSIPNYPAFERVVERLVDAAELWQARLVTTF